MMILPPKKRWEELNQTMPALPALVKQASESGNLNILKDHAIIFW